MCKKIVMITSFAEYHLLECLIPNIIDIINPNKIIISEGKMPIGPENKGFHDIKEFDEKWTFEGKGLVGFDWLKTKSLEEKYKGLVEIREMKYNSNLTATECYIQSISTADFVEGDLVFCLESDSFIYEGDKDLLELEIINLQIGQGLSIKYVDFLETQYYTENINLILPKYRRFVYKFDNITNFQTKMGFGYLTQNYPELKKIDSFFVRHYCWWRPGEYKQLRYDLIKRNDQYWKDFEMGLQNIQLNSRRKLAQEKRDLEIKTQAFVHASKIIPSESRVLIRPSRQDEARWAQLIDVPHPEAIKSHPNYVK